MFDKTTEATYPLSPLQQGMLFHSVSEPTSGVYVQQKILKLREALDVEAFSAAWQYIVDRHTVLRTLFRLSDADGPVQAICPHSKISIDHQDWRSLTEAERQSRMQKFLQTDRRLGFDFEAGPPMRLALFWMKTDEYEFVWTSHHALLDGRSYVILLEELFNAYEAVRDTKPLRGDLPKPYQEYIRWLSDQDFVSSEKYWRDSLTEFESPTPLTVDREHKVPAGEEIFSVKSVRVSASTTQNLQFLAETHGATLNNCIQASWSILLSRYSGRSDVLFGTTRACRSSFEGARDMVGLFINTVPFPVHLEPQATVGELLRALRSQQVELRAYEHTPLSLIQKWSPFPNQTQLFESVIVFENFLVANHLHNLNDAWANRDFRLEERTNYPLTVSVYQDNGLILKIGYDRRRFDDRTVNRLLDHLRTLLEGMSRPQMLVKDLPLITEAEKKELLVNRNQTEEEYPQLCVHELFEKQAAQTPDSVAVIAEDATLTFSELNLRANRLAHHLKSLGVGPDVLVGIMLHRSADLLVSMLGVLKAGGAYLPLDPSTPKQRISFMLGDADVAVAITHEDLRSQLPDDSLHVLTVGAEPEIERQSSENLNTAVTPDHLVYVIYTSGSTGNPKGVMVRHQGVVNYLCWCVRAYCVNEKCGSPVYSAVSFDLPVTGLYAPLIVGRTVYMVAERHGADSLRVAMEQDRTYSLIKITPAHLELIGMQLTSDRISDATRFFVIGGEDLPARTTAFWKKNAPNTVLVNEYGPTETVVGCCVYTVPPGSETAGSIPIGRPIANTRLYVVDGNLEPVPIGVPGELLIGGDGVARGYLNRPELTAEKFIADPFRKDQHARVYRSGDLVRWCPDGNLQFLGRMDHQVKIRGYRIELGEIESVVAQFSGVSDAVVDVHAHSPGVQQLVAYVVAESAQSIDIGKLRAFVQERLPEYMVPTAFQTLSELPFTPSGKVDRNSLPKPNPTHKRSKELVAARDETEVELVRIWEELLDQSPISIHDNFFELGGDSLLAMRLLLRIKKQFSQKFSDMSIYQAPTVAKLARVLNEPAGDALAETSVIVPIKVEGGRPPFFLAGLAAGDLVRNLAENLSSDRPFYAILTKKLGDEAYYGETVPTATRLISEIRTVQPEGPYYLGTFCNQGAVMLEVAQQLLAQGENVAMLAMIEAAAPGKRKFSYRVRRVIYRDYHRLKTHFQTMKRLSLSENVGYTFELSSNLVSRYVKKVSRLNQRLKYLGNQFIGRKPAEELQYSKAVNALLYRKYTPQIYAGRISVFLGRMSHFLHDRTMGWSRLAANIDVEVLAGNHTDMLRKPNVVQFAQRLEATMDRAEEELAQAGPSK